jgi:hypothetical protein
VQLVDLILAQAVREPIAVDQRQEAPEIGLLLARVDDTSRKCRPGSDAV